METCLLVLYDKEEEYARLMSEFLKKHRDLPWEIHTYTKEEELWKQEQKGKISILVASESVYSKKLKELQPQRTIILKESNVIQMEDVFYIDKYQKAENVLKGILEVYVEITDVQFPVWKMENHTKFIGMYSPVRRCLQTSFAVTMGQMLAKEHSVLYLNFEHYAGITELLPDIQTRDMADLLYFLNIQKDKFRLRMQAIIQQKGNLYYIPPMKSGQNLIMVTAKEWLKLLQRIAEFGQYEYVVMDLSESMQGLFDILRMCSKVFTLTENDKISRSKVMQYEQILELYEYDDILQKTCKCMIPKIKKLPEGIEQYTKGELAEYVKAQMRELEHI